MSAAPRHLVGLSDLHQLPEIYWRRYQPLLIEHLGGPRDGEWTELHHGELVRRTAELPSAGGFYLLAFVRAGAGVEPCWRWITTGGCER